MNEIKFDKIICDDYSNLEQYLSSNTVSLSIVVPPQYDQKNKDSFLVLSKILQKIANVTIPGGICCIVASDEIDPKTDVMSMESTKLILQILDSKDESSEWIIDDKILWVKSTKEKVDSLNPMEEGTLISFDQTPFSTIFVLVKQGSNLEPISITDRLWNLRISEKKKTEMSDFIWFIHPTSEKGYLDKLPKEIIIRLIMLFSKEDDLVLDPFANYGITAIASKILKRHYFCIDKNSKKIDKAKERIKTISGA